MFPVHYITREGGIVSKATSAAVDLAVAVAGAQHMLRDLRRIPAEPGRPHPAGFLIFDATGERLLHQELVGT